MRRMLRWVGRAALLVLLFLPSAQAAAQVTFQFVDSSHEMVLPENGKALHTLTVQAWATEFVCTDKARVSINMGFTAPFDTWAGASINPSGGHLTFNISANHPGTSNESLGQNRTKLEIEWNTENRPKTDARWTYEIQVLASSYQIEGAACAPQTVARLGPPARVTVSMPDVPPDAPPANCEEETDTVLPECASEMAPPPGGDSPAVGGAFVALVVLALAVGVRRRR